MSLHPFLCHARADQALLVALKDELSIHGADGWQDVESLRVGGDTRVEIRRVIRDEAGGFIILLTSNSLASRFIREVEVPEALTRAGLDQAFPVVPLFYSAGPRDMPRRGSFRNLPSFNGAIRHEDEEEGPYWARSAAKYVESAVISRGGAPISVGISCTSPPRQAHDLTLDWRSLVGPGRELSEAGVARARSALTNLRDAFHAAGISEVTIIPDLYLPLALLVGYEWSAVTGLRLEVIQRNAGGVASVRTHLVASVPLCEPSVSPLGGDGPAVVVVAVNGGMEKAVHSYAVSVDASETITFAVSGVLDSNQIGALAAQVARALSDLRDQGREKHLLIKGPVSLALLIGAAGNAMGRTTVPLWDLENGYLPGPVIGGRIALQAGTV